MKWCGVLPDPRRKGLWRQTLRWLCLPSTVTSYILISVCFLVHLNPIRLACCVCVCACVFTPISPLIWWYQRKKPAWPLLKTASSGRLEIFSFSSAVLEVKIFIIRTFCKSVVCLPLSNENLEHSSHLYHWDRHDLGEEVPACLWSWSPCGEWVTLETFMSSLALGTGSFK